MKSKNKWSLALGCVGLLVVGFIVLVLGGYIYSSTASAASQSVVYIREPVNGDRVAAGEPVLVRALARDDHNITRIELWVDGQLFDEQTSNTPGGIDPFPLLTTWYPSAGRHMLIVRAFNGQGTTTQTSVIVDAVAVADRDADGVADEADTCPDHPGTSGADGCPDRDSDGIPDSADACPDDAGLPEDGCPAPSESDRDGDGFLDSADACPDVAGSPLADGCPDVDGDGVGDARDACPAEPGGGVDGCPEPGGGEPAPDPEPGGGEPVPEPEPLPGSDPPEPGSDAPEPGPGGDGDFDLDTFIDLEIEAYEMRVSDELEHIWCYVRLGEEDPRRYDFDALGETYWNIAAELGGENSVRILHAPNEPLLISVDCWGANEGEVPVDLGLAEDVYPPEVWDGREQFLWTPIEGTTTPRFSVKHHICSPSCDEAAVQAPLLAPIGLGPIGEGPYTLRWRWDDSGLEGWTNFRLARYVDGEFNTFVDIGDLEMRSLDVADYMPACGETVEFRMRYMGYEGGEERHTPWSNSVPWPGEPCTYTASVTFTLLEVHNPPADEDGLHRPGPIYGEFWAASGSTTEDIFFDACWRPAGPFAWARDCEGLKLQIGTYSIPRDIFGWIDTRIAECLGNGCRSNSFYAPSNSSIHVPFEDGGDITFGARIMDCDSGNSDDVVFQEQGGIRINVEEDLEYLTEPLSMTLNGEHLNISLFVRLSR